jgi:hypothetical protein
MLININNYRRYDFLFLVVPRHPSPTDHPPKFLKHPFLQLDDDGDDYCDSQDDEATQDDSWLQFPSYGMDDLELDLQDCKLQLAGPHWAQNDPMWSSAGGPGPCMVTNPDWDPETDIGSDYYSRYMYEQEQRDKNNKR